MFILHSCLSSCMRDYSIRYKANATGEHSAYWFPVLLLNITHISAGSIHRESKKTRHQTLSHNFANYYPIFKFFSLADSVVNLQQTRLNIPPLFKHVATLPCEI